MKSENSSNSESFINGGSYKCLRSDCIFEAKNNTGLVRHIKSHKDCPRCGETFSGTHSIQGWIDFSPNGKFSIWHLKKIRLSKEFYEISRFNFGIVFSTKCA